MGVKRELTKRLVSLVVGAGISLSSFGCLNTNLRDYPSDK
jgi:hypothetical protein